MVFVNIEFLGRKATFHSYRCEWEETVYLFGGDSYNLSGWFSCLLAMAQRYYEYSKLNNDKDKRKLVVLENVDIETNKICDNKYITLKKRLWKIKNGQIVDIPQIVSNPCEQLKHILDKMNNCLCKLLYQKEYSINSDELYISLYYNFPMENNVWRQADSLSPEKGNY